MADTQALAALIGPPKEKYRFVALVPPGSPHAPLPAPGSAIAALPPPTVYIVLDSRGRLLVERRMPTEHRNVRHCAKLAIHSTMDFVNVLKFVDAFYRYGSWYTPDDRRPEALALRALTPRYQLLHGRSTASLYTEYCPLGTLHQLRVRLARACAEAAGVAWHPPAEEAPFDPAPGAGAGAPLLPEPGDAATRQALDAVEPLLPEAFVWHVLLSLVRAVLYVRGTLTHEDGHVTLA